MPKAHKSAMPWIWSTWSWGGGEGRGRGLSTSQQPGRKVQFGQNQASVEVLRRFGSTLSKSLWGSTKRVETMQSPNQARFGPSCTYRRHQRFSRPDLGVPGVPNVRRQPNVRHPRATPRRWGGCVGRHGTAHGGRPLVCCTTPQVPHAWWVVGRENPNLDDENSTNRPARSFREAPTEQLPLNNRTFSQRKIVCDPLQFCFF